jgi:hypothetical protein
MTQPTVAPPSPEELAQRELARAKDLQKAFAKIRSQIAQVIASTLNISADQVRLVASPIVNPDGSRNVTVYIVDASGSSAGAADTVSALNRTLTEDPLLKTVVTIATPPYVETRLGTSGAFVPFSNGGGTTGPAGRYEYNVINETVVVGKCLWHQSNY